MTEINETQNKRNPYEKKLQNWEIEVKEIETFIDQLPNVNILNVGISIFEKLTSSHNDKLSKKYEKLDKIKSGVAKMTETLSLTMSDDLSNPDLDNYLKRIVDLRLKISHLIVELSKKDPKKYLQSINDK